MKSQHTDFISSDDKEGMLERIHAENFTEKERFPSAEEELK
jgi:hypothetical protein